jgi:hypothetical protein
MNIMTTKEHAKKAMKTESQVQRKPSSPKGAALRKPGVKSQIASLLMAGRERHSHHPQQ